MIRVVAGLFVRGDCVLVQRRPPGKARGLLWEFPGGKVESGETDAQALVRECEEELGVAPAVGELTWHTTHAYADLVVDLWIYRATLPAGVEAVALEAHALAWVPRAELSGLSFCPADEELVAGLVEGRVELSPAPGRNA
jgi:8-oxo-dGTP diphosphatase